MEEKMQTLQTPRTPLQFRQWLVTQIDLFTDWSKPMTDDDIPDGAEFTVVNEEPPGPDLNVFEDAADIVREAGEIALRFGLPDLFRECYVRTPMLAIRTAKETLGRCLAACDKLPPDMAVTEPQKRPKGLAFTSQRALRQYERAEEVLGENLTDDRAYRWLRSHTEPDDPPILDCETWKRYLRDGRRFYGIQKNSPRAGRTGGSVVSIHDIESLHGGDDYQDE
jgi:hypothetical protein